MSGGKISRIAAQYDPSAICIEFADSKGKMKYLRFNVAFAYFTVPDALVLTLTTDYEEYFNEKCIPRDKLNKFIHTVIEKAPKKDLANSNKEEIDKFKEQMNREFEMNVIKPGDPGYKFDVQEDFSPGEDAFDWD